MALPEFTMRELLEAGVHFGHHTRRWNPKMKNFIYGDRNGVHIIDLSQTVPMLHDALQAVRDTVRGGGRVLFVGTKRAAQERIAEAAKACGQYYVNHRWLGGMLTNWATISNSIRRLKELDEILSRPEQLFTKRETLSISRERDNLDRALGGIKDMGGLPDILVIIDTNKESIAIAEATKLGIPVVAVVDTNCDPAQIQYPVPGNDDAMRAIDLYCRLFSDAALDGIEAWKADAGVDAGASADAPRVKLDGSDADGDAKGKSARKGGGKKPVAKKADANGAGEAEETGDVEAKPAKSAKGEGEGTKAAAPL
jgi:small subunit ribosomal protein S2